MVKPSTARMKNPLRYPHGYSLTASPRQRDRIEMYIAQRAREEGLTRYLTTEALRELVDAGLDAKLDAPDTRSSSSQESEAA